MQTTKQIQMDLLSKGNVPSIYAVQGDTAREIKFLLHAAGVPWVIPEDSAVLIRYRKTDGTKGVYDTLPDGSKAWYTDKNSVSIMVAPQMLTVPGVVHIQISVFNEDKVLSTFAVTMIVDEDVAYGATSSEDYTNIGEWILPQAVAAANKAEENAILAETYSKSADGYMKETKTALSEVSSIRNNVLDQAVQAALAVTSRFSLTFELGRFDANGEEKDGTNAVRSSFFPLLSSDITIVTPYNTRWAVFCYDKTHSFIENGIIYDFDGKTTITPPDGTYFLRMVAQRDDSQAIENVEEFTSSIAVYSSSDLPESLFELSVSVAGNPTDGYIASHTINDIQTAREAGQKCSCVLGSVILPLVDTSGGVAIFSAVLRNKEYRVEIGEAVNVYAMPVSGNSFFTSFAKTTVDIDKTSRTVTLNEGYVFTGTGRIDVQKTTVSLNTESGMSLLVYDTAEKSVLSINPSNIRGDQIMIAAISRDYPHLESANRIPGLWSVNGKIIPDFREYFGKFVTYSDCIYSLNTADNTLIVSDGYLFVKNTRTPISQKALTLNLDSVFNALVYDFSTVSVKCINPSNIDAENMVTIAIISRNYPTSLSANFVSGPFKVDGKLYGGSTATSVVSVDAVYVSTDGSDSASGGRDTPFKTIGKAVRSGAKTVIVFAGTYKESVSAANVGGELEILAKPLSNTNKDVIIDFGTDLELVEDSASGLVKADFASTENDFIYKAFVSQSEKLIYADSFISDGYSCNLWRGDVKLVPVLTFEACRATAGTWFYDGSSVYANAEAGVFTLNDGATDYGLSLSYYKKVKLLGITVRHAKTDAVRLLGCTDAEIMRCGFAYTGLYNGLALENSSAIVRSCEAKYNRTDGLNIHGVSTADFIDCVSHDNGDDGISHHDQSGGMVIGGEYYNNKKGGVCSPTFGSRNSIAGAYIHGNGTGVYAVTGGDGVYPNCNVSDCLIEGNNVGICADRYTLNCWNVALVENQENVSEKNGGIVNMVGADGYKLPVANKNTLGGVKPMPKTEKMELDVGVDADGRLYVDAYSKATVDAALGTYIQDVDALIGGEG